MLSGNLGVANEGRKESPVIMFLCMGLVSLLSSVSLENWVSLVSPVSLENCESGESSESGEL